MCQDKCVNRKVPCDFFCLLWARSCSFFRLLVNQVIESNYVREEKNICDVYGRKKALTNLYFPMDQKSTTIGDAIIVRCGGTCLEQSHPRFNTRYLLNTCQEWSLCRISNNSWTLLNVPPKQNRTKTQTRNLQLQKWGLG